MRIYTGEKTQAELERQEHPPVLWVGIGCQRGTSRQVIETAIQQICQQNQLAESAIAGIATIDLKANEVGLVELCRDRNWPLRTFSPTILRSISVPNPSTAVAQVGTPSVAEAAALCATSNSNYAFEIIQNPSRSLASANTRPKIQNPKSKIQNSLLVPKQIFRLEGQPGAVTVAIAQLKREYLGAGESRL